MRNITLAEGEIYHVYNRGVDKRNITQNPEDVDRFIQSLCEFNREDPIGSIYEHSFIKKDSSFGSRASKSGKLVEFIAYCLLPNHYHFIIRQVQEKGIEKFMHRFGTGYTKYFNAKYDRSGSLFQGKFKASHVDSNGYLLHLSAYVNLNNKAHQLGSSASKLVRSSWDEYCGKPCEQICKKDIILEQFTNPKKYQIFSNNSLKEIIQKKISDKELKSKLFE